MHFIAVREWRKSSGFVIYFPRRDFAQKAKSRGGTLSNLRLLPPQGFRPEAKSPGGTPSNSRVY